VTATHASWPVIDVGHLGKPSSIDRYELPFLQGLGVPPRSQDGGLRVSLEAIG
jgi:hypothetical protein